MFKPVPTLIYTMKYLYNWSMNQFIFAIVLSLMFNTTVYSASKKIAILYDEMFLTHFTGENHPENAERLKTVISDLRMNNELLPYLLWPPIKDINKPILELVHDTNYIALVEKEVAAIRDSGISYLSTGDTVISKNSLAVAKKAVAAAVFDIASSCSSGPSARVFTCV